jgi:MFS family permease
LWLLASAFFALVRERPGATEGGGNAIVEALRSLVLLRDDAPFRRFVTVRALLLCSALSAPYYVLLATGMGGVTVSTLGMFVLANGLASSLSAPVWGRLADASSKRVLIRAGVLSSGLGIVMALIVFLLPALAVKSWIYPLAFFILGIAHSGVRLGRKTYVIDMAGGNKRTDYVAVSNTMIGLILILTSLVGLLAAVISPAGVILVLSAMGITGAALGSGLPEVQ